MFLIQKYTQYKAAQAEQQKRKVTEKELAQLNHKIVSYFPCNLPHLVHSRLVISIIHNMRRFFLNKAIKK
jgi:hypothetical protein